MGSFEKRNGWDTCTKTIKRSVWWTYAVKNFLGIVEIQPVLEKCFKAATKLKRGWRTEIDMETLSIMELPFLAADTHVKILQGSQKTDLDI